MPIGSLISDMPARGDWFRLGNITLTQEETIRAYARREGFKTLRGWASHMRSTDWDYYKVLAHESPE